MARIRRGQLVAPFGVGSLSVLKDGTSVLTGGLDLWFVTRPEFQHQVLQDEFRIEEDRLQRELGVDYFLAPPDFRESSRPGGSDTNKYLFIPAFRFPTWHVCRYCKRMIRAELTQKEKVRCPECNGWRTAQVRFLAMCDHGHVQDFPWNEWAHKSVVPRCQGPMKLEAKAGASLDAIVVKCTACPAERNLAGIMSSSADGNSSAITDQLAADKQPFNCRGHRPWLGTATDSQCARPLRGTLRNASNLYFSDIATSIYLPISPVIPRELDEFMEQTEVDFRVQTMRDLRLKAEEIGPELRNTFDRQLRRFPDSMIKRVVCLKWGLPDPEAATVRKVAADSKWTAFRREEYDVMLSGRNDDNLISVKADLAGKKLLLAYFSDVMLIKKLRETRALADFGRVLPNKPEGAPSSWAMMRATPAKPFQNWLPAYVVYGEGILLSLKGERVSQWERAIMARDDLKKRLRILLQHIQNRTAPNAHRISQEELPRMLLLHTLAHVLMNSLTFECGYSSAALRERLYFSTASDGPMAGLLIYTAAGDSEGTMGGLVRMGEPAMLERLLIRTLRTARWCSTDPICSELAEHGGQGPDSTNLAACHNCGLVPETACEFFNRFLDRGMLVGNLVSGPGNGLGYFDGFESQLGPDEG